jgi:RNA-directed DNA polymerase
MSRSLRTLTRAIASALLAGPWTAAEMRARVRELLGPVHGEWLDALIAGVRSAFPEPPHDARDALAAAIVAGEWLAEPISNRQLPRRLRHVLIDAPAMREPRWPVRRLDTLHDVARWLELDDATLDWLADRRGLEHLTGEPKLQNYVYAWVPKRSGGARLLESPKPRLKAAQRRVLHDVLDAIPPHDAAHGFCRGRSVLTHARLHVAQPVVVRFDLRNFFSDVKTARAYGIFRAAGYPEEVARTLIALCTNRVPLSVLRLHRPAVAHEIDTRFHLHRRLAGHHLPQGAPTSPALANLCAFPLDTRLRALANALGLTYSRYADDLAFSGDASFAHAIGRLARQVGEIVRDEGFTLNDRKQRLMRGSSAQLVTGVVVNRHPNVPRAAFDRLKATLHRCRTRGPDAALAPGETRAHLRSRLLGEVSWVESVNPPRGERLRASFEAIDWGEALG